MALFRIVIGLMLVFVASNFVSAATISGTVYDFSLETSSNVRLDIDTEPKQRFVSRDGEFFFEVKPGNYTITAKKYDQLELVSTSSENVLIEEDRIYTVDLILFPTLVDETDLDIFDEEVFLDSGFFQGGFNYYKLSVIILSLIILSFIGYRAYYFKKKKKPIVEEKAEPVVNYTINVDVEEEPQVTEEQVIEDEVSTELELVIKFIKESGGRTTQKDIRKKFPSSEAKISLVLTELEHKGKIEKIKKGRGNVIVLKGEAESHNKEGQISSN